MKKLTNQEILDLPMQENDADAKTIRGYLQELLLELWREQESFSGKRPFGNSGWEYDLYIPLIKANAVKGKLDENGYIEEVDQAKAYKLIVNAIKSLF